MFAHQPSPVELEAAADEAADDEALAEYEAKGGVSHEAIRAWILSWGTPDELPRPQIGD
jgi:predicted transcriptional regulator